MMECHDVLVHVGEEARITARLSFGDIVRLLFRLRGRTIRFGVNGKEIGEVKTARDGSATILYTPRHEREYRAVATYQPPRRTERVTAEATIFSRSTSREAIILDVDRTLFASSTLSAIFRKSRSIQPLEDAVEVTRALACKYDLIIVTGRKSYLRHKTKRWLRDRGFPAAPVYFAPPFRPSLSHERFKVELIRQLKAAWENITIGVGDRDSDARAYRSNHLKAIILREKGPCPPGAVVVPDWQSIRDMLLG